MKKTGKVLFNISLISILILLAVAVNVGAYETSPGRRWPSGAATNLKYTVNTRGVPQSLDFNSLVKRSTSTWGEVLPEKLHFKHRGVNNSISTVPGTHDGANTFSWLPCDTVDTCNIGVTYYWYDTETNEMQEFDIFIYGVDGFVDNPNPLPGQLDVQQTLTHETGHTLWLGHSENSEAVMYYAYHDGRELHQDDIDGLKALYSSNTSGSAQADGGGGGCFIATAAYGSYQEPHVRILRQFRDRFLLTNTPGAAFVDFYYRNSPPLAAWIAQRPAACAITRTVLLPVYGFSYLAVHGLLPLAFLLPVTGILGFLIIRRKRKNVVQ